MTRGHNSEQGLDDYDSGDENEQRMMSNIIDNARSASSSRQVLHLLSSVHDQTQSRSTSLSQGKQAYKRIMLQDSDSD